MRRGRYFTKTFGVVPGRKWRKIYLVSEFGLRPLLFSEWRRSPEYQKIAKELAAPSADHLEDIQLPFAAATFAAMDAHLCFSSRIGTSSLEVQR